MKVFTTYLDERLHRRLKKVSLEMGKPIYAIINEAIEKYLDELSITNKGERK